jgi:FlaA1/EpsC-like NDP-sugar epimerase
MRKTVLLAEVGLTAISYTFSLLLILGLASTDSVWRVLAITLPILLVLRTGVYILLGLSSRSLRHASISDLICIGKAVLISSILFFLTVKSGAFRVHLPIAIFILDWALLQFLLGGLHAGVGVYQTQKASHRTKGRRVLIVGAGDAGVSVVKEFATNFQSPFVPVAIIDDDLKKQGITICGVPVLCGVQDLARVALEKTVEEVLICIPSATRSQMKRILSACRECGVPVRALPSLAELVSDRVSPSDLRHVHVEDILQREDPQWEPDGFHGSVSKRTALVTGAGGTIGSELARQIAVARPGRLLLLDKSENSLFHIHLELKERFPELRLQTHLLDVTREEAVHRLFGMEKPDLVFHAAAYKHVGLLEEHPEEAIRNNVLGTRNVGMAALDSCAFAFVNISTDKAVSPSSYMGLSKRITELCIQELSQRGSTRFMNVRFGNVAGSSGSVLRLFSEQIQKGGPLRVTDRDATRYFMTIPEAVFLTLQAATQGQGGETFVFDMGEPIRIYDLARTVSLFSGCAPGRDLKIEFIGLRQGEKMSEELWEQWECPVATIHKKILAINERHPLSHGMLERVQHLEACLVADERGASLAYLHDLFPDFLPNRTRRGLRPPEAEIAGVSLNMGEVLL